MFQLTKWYLDIVTAQGDTLIAYAAQVRLAGVPLRYASVLLSRSSATGGEESAVTGVEWPSLDGEACTWQHQALGISGRWHRDAPSIARFVEESYRAEPQTPTIAGLHSYQWLALASLLGGIACTMLPGGGAAAGLEVPSAPLWWSALGVALLAGFAMGVDFPASNRRYSRLAAAD